MKYVDVDWNKVA